MRDLSVMVLQVETYMLQNFVVFLSLERAQNLLPPLEQGCNEVASKRDREPIGGGIFQNQ